jgi:probable phosphoglycerate mutase
VWPAAPAGTALGGERGAAIYSSDLLRAKATAAAGAATTGAPLTADKGLRERCFGSFEGQTFSDIEATHPEDALRWRKRDPEFVPAGGGESLLMLRDRIAATVERLAGRHAGEQIVIVAHGGVMDVLYRLATRQEVQAPRTWALGNAAINRLLWTPQGLGLVGWGDVQHLEGGARDEVFS